MPPIVIFHILNATCAPSAPFAAFIVTAPEIFVCPCIVKESIALLFVTFMPPLNVKLFPPGSKVIFCAFMPSDIILTEFPTHFAPSETSVTFCEYPLFEIVILLKFTSLSTIVALKTFAELPPLPTVIFISPKLSPPVIVEFTAASAVPSIARLALSRELPSGLQTEVSDHSNSVANIPSLVFKVRSSAVAQIANANKAEIVVYCIFFFIFFRCKTAKTVD